MERLPSSKTFLYKPSKQKGAHLQTGWSRKGGKSDTFSDGVINSHSLLALCQVWGEWGFRGKTQPKHPKNSWSSWQNRDINRQKQHNLGMTMEAWCVCVGGSTPVGVWRRGQLWKEGKARYTERGENRGLEVAAVRRGGYELQRSAVSWRARCERWNTESEG